MLANLVNGISNNIGKLINVGGDAIVRFVTGIGNQGSRVISAGTSAVEKLISALGSNSASLAQKGADAIITFLNSIANTIRTREPALIAAGASVGAAIVQGMINGVGSLGGALLSKVGSLISSIPGKAKKLLGIGSPSKVFHEIGTNIVEGLTNGIDENADAPANSVTVMTQSIIDSMSALGDMTEMNPTITPVVDLTQVQAGADQMNSIFATTPIVPTVSADQASSISASQVAQGGATDTTSPDKSVIKFEQNNYSPESLSPVEIYRQTKNQLSQMRTALALS
jgi:hypothetical protein